MSIQRMLIEEALRLLPRVYNIIQRSNKFERNQMIQVTLHEMLIHHKSAVEMNETEILNFQEDLIDRFKHNGWIENK